MCTLTQPSGQPAGFLLGSRQTLLETKDGGRTWEPRQVAAAEDEGFNYRFTSISFAGQEGWIVGKPAILLHTTDGGANWERVPLSAKLPGNPVMIYATGKSGNAEMTTDQVCWGQSVVMSKGTSGVSPRSVERHVAQWLKARGLTRGVRGEQGGRIVQHILRVPLQGGFIIFTSLSMY
jgi:photosystem II stability/assembly factor-like uncharacterized protein